MSEYTHEKIMTLVSKQSGLLAIKNREEIYLHIRLGDARWKLHSSAPSKNKVKSFSDKMQGAIRPRLNYTKVHLLNANRNNWEYGDFDNVLDDWNHSVIRNKSKSQMLVEYRWALIHEHMSMNRLTPIVHLLSMNRRDWESGATSDTNSCGIWSLHSGTLRRGEG